MRPNGYRHWPDGRAAILRGMSGIAHNASFGGRAFGRAADCIHPGISIRQAEDMRNRGLNVYACVGNRAKVMTGQAAGTVAVVTGKSVRFSEKVIVHLPKTARAKMAVGDQIIIRSEGIGMAMIDHPGVMLKGIGPNLLAALQHRVEGAHIDFGVVATIPAHLEGAGLGLTTEGGSLHLQSTDKGKLAKHGLDALRFGDIVALADTDSRHNHGYLQGARAIGVVCASDGPRAGFGPGIAILMTAPAGELGSFAAPGTSIADLLAEEP
jgi:hypothetical protein